MHLQKRFLRKNLKNTSKEGICNGTWWDSKAIYGSAFNTLNANDVNILEYKKPTIEILDDEPDLSSGYVGNVEPVASQSISNDDSVKIEEKDIDLSDLSDMFN